MSSRDKDVATAEGSEIALSPWNRSFPLVLLPEFPAFSGTKLTYWLAFFVVLGVVARLVRYGLCFPLWGDEAFLAVNYLDRSFAEMLLPLEYHQFAPLGYLWLQLATVKLVGFHEWGLRLVALLASFLAIALYWQLCRRLFKGTTFLLAIAMFCVAYPVVRYSAEAKPYGTDLLVSLTWMVLLVEWLYRPEQKRWLAALLVFAPLSALLSLTTVFLGGATSIVLFAVFICQRRWTALPWWLGISTAMTGVFFWHLKLMQPSLGGTRLEEMQETWSTTFPPSWESGQLIGWLAETFCSDIFMYPIGGANHGSILTAISCVIAVVWLLRTKKYTMAGLLTLPLLLNIVAAFLHRYPLGGHVRFALYYAPCVLLLHTFGIAVFVTWLSSRRIQLSKRTFYGLMAGCILIAVGSMARDFVKPSKSYNEVRARGFAQWFWHDEGIEAELVCLHRDLGVTFSPLAYEWGYSSVYQCNRRIYSPRHAAGEPVRYDQVSNKHPLRCIEYFAPGYPYDEAKKAAWIAEMEKDYQLTGIRRFPFPFYHKDREYRRTDYLVVYEFMPLERSESESAPRRSAETIAREFHGKFDNAATQKR
ncbi:Hypothetical protein PBC10988_5670 [Planctomycetales bacterium 10988]|nr:Hypothetical protein PBC10988_5670 [Planctomycetales bacterium 10988]